MIHVTKGDTVRVMRGDDREGGQGHSGLPQTGRIKVEGINIVKKHRKARTAEAERHHRDGRALPRVERDAARFEDRQADAHQGAPRQDGTKERVGVKSGEVIPRALTGARTMATKEKGAEGRREGWSEGRREGWRCQGRCGPEGRRQGRQAGRPAAAGRGLHEAGTCRCRIAGGGPASEGLLRKHCARVAGQAVRLRQPASDPHAHEDRDQLRRGRSGEAAQAARRGGGRARADLRSEAGAPRRSRSRTSVSGKARRSARR